MASIFKRTRSYPIPEAAEILERRRKATAAELREEPHRKTIVERFAKWIDSKTGRARKAPVVTKQRCGRPVDLVVIEASTYTIAYFDAAGKRQETNSGTPDFSMAKRIAAEIEKEVVMRRRGHIDATQERLAKESQRVIDEQIADFEATMNAARRDPKHIKATMGYIRQLTLVAGWQVVGDIDATPVNAYVSDLLAAGKSARLAQATLTALKSFTRWLVKHGKLATDPLAAVQKPNPAKDRRHERRMLLHEEWEWLRTTTAGSADRFRMTGQERMLLYAVAIQTGLRSSECRSLTRGRLFLEGAQPYVTCKARSTKNAKDCRQYIQPELANELVKHIATKAPAAPVFSMPNESNVSRMFRADLLAARQAWVQASRGPGERLQREQSDFLTQVNHEGERLDFHALRHTCGAWLAKAGAHPKVVQTVMRHSTITLTMDCYGHLFPGQDAAAVAALPEMINGTKDAPEDLQATGTHGGAGSILPAYRQQSSSEFPHEAASACELDKGTQNTADGPKSLPFNGLRETVQESAGQGGSAPTWTRTMNPLIKSQMLCQLSYRGGSPSGNACGRRRMLPRSLTENDDTRKTPDRRTWGLRERVFSRVGGRIAGPSIYGPSVSGSKR